MEDRKDIVYSNNYTKGEVIYTLKTLFSYLGIVALWAYLVHIYMDYGKWITLAISGMWILGAIGVLIIAEQRESTISETKNWILGYLAFLLVYRFVIQHISGYTSAQMSAALNINNSSVDGSSISRLIQSLLGTASVLTPLSYGMWMAKKFKTFKSRKTKHEELQKLKGFINERRSR